MKKLFFCALAGAIGFAGTKTYLISQESEENELTLQNVEALSMGDLPPGDWHSNFTIGTVWYNSSMEIRFSKPWISLGWSSMRCCLTSVDSNSCNFSNEDSNCKNYAVRSAH